MIRAGLLQSTNLPSSYYEARKIILDLGFDYMRIDAGENDCMLFWKEDINVERCKVCGLLR